MKKGTAIFLRCLAGLIAGWMAGDLHYLIFRLLPHGDDNPIFNRRDVGALTLGSTAISLFFVLFSLLVGLVFFVRPLYRVWVWAGRWVIVISLAGAAGIFFYNPHVGGPVPVSEASVFLTMSFYVMLIFPIVNWPGKLEENHLPN